MSVVTLLPRIIPLNSTLLIYEKMKMIHFGIQSSLLKWPIQTLPLPLLSGFFSRNGTVVGGEKHRIYNLPVQGTATGKEWI